MPKRTPSAQAIDADRTASDRALLLRVTARMAAMDDRLQGATVIQPDGTIDDLGAGLLRREGRA